MNTSPSFLPHEEYIRAAPDPQLSSSQSNLLTNLLKQEDQYQYYQLLNTTIPIDIQHLLNQVGSCLVSLIIFIITSFFFFQLCSLLHLSSSATWMATVLLKKLLIQQHSLDLLTILACVTLSSKYQDSLSQSIDYELLAECYDIDNIQHIHVSFLFFIIKQYHIYKFDSIQ